MKRLPKRRNTVYCNMFDSSAYTSRGRFKKTRFTPSSVDETLFGERRTTLEPDPVPKFEPPWVDNGKTKLKPPPKPLLFYCPGSPSRPTSSSRTTNTTPERKYKPTKFSPTVIDHTLFDSGRTKQGVKTDKFFTSMPHHQLHLDGSIRESSEEDSFRLTNNPSRPNSRREKQHELKKTLPPWR
ncbi:uncharacterized protein LOC110234347 [Exaiptasia diaphana]|uniref:RBPJ-interacting and tubulin-associated protein 1 n=1 Tax=Exaiptasia diaphana TaxID=2652724 RepID=A0A913WX06_EXADI|nr:uncharacterized protein LOC110234347 [Exaiptasia diaphana]